MIGTTLGHYRVLEKLGAGGMGEVYAAEDTRLQRRVALKLLPADMAADAERLHRFQREARAVAALNHPNIVTIYAVEEAGGIQFLTMELVEGKTLAEAIPTGGMPLEDLLTLAVPLVDAVAFAHQHGIVHRDLKPANIMLTDDRRLKVLDFGLAKLKPEFAAAETGETTRLATQSLTQGQVVIGTPWYMSPEQAEGRPVDHRSDIFSLGVVLYEMACGRRPFQGDTAVSVISSIIKDTPAPLSGVNKAAPPALDRIVTRALAKDPAERYQHAVELRDDLRQVQAQTASVRVVSNLLRAVVRSRWTWRLAMAGGFVALVAAGAWYWRSGRDGAGRRTQSMALRFRTDRLSAQPGVEQFPSLLPDGKWVLYSGQETGNKDIYLLSTSGQKAINLTADSPADDDEPVASPDGERIAFRSSREGGGIFVMGRTGEGVRRVTPTGVSAAFNPSWSPDATEVAYTTEDVQLTPLNWESGQSAIWIVNVTTAEQRRLDTGNAVQPSWSPHGHRIAYVARGQRTKAGDSGVTKFMDIYTVPPRGGAPMAATDDLANDWSPAWSPDGRYLYFASDRGGSMNLWRVPIAEASGKPLGDPEPVTSGVPFLAHPSISTDGRRIAYCAKLETGNINTIALDPRTAAVRGEPMPVTTGSQAWANPDPTLDGEWVVFYSRNEPEGDLYVTRSDGTGQPRQLTSDAAKDRVPRWSPDNQWIAFTSDRSGPFALWKIRFDGGGLTQIASPHTVYPVWSPDGTRLAAQSAAEVSGAGERFTVELDPNRSPETQTPKKLPLPDAALQPFHAQDWSHDGKRLAGQIGMGSSAKGIVIYTFASRTYERMTDFGEWPAWLPDNRRVLFVTGGKEYWVVDTETKRTKSIYRVPRGVLGPARLTRDGRMAVFPLRLLEADIYLLTFEE